jgi:predicted polyphosphate/ATP-dependent NAD kinase
MHLILFVGGDGTARDVLDAMSNGVARVEDGSAQTNSVPVIGIPAGVKMHSGVFATSPRRAAELLKRLSSGALVAAVAAEVRDIDEDALRDGRLVARTYGELLVPQLGGYLQQVKSGGREVEALVLLEIAAEIDETLISCTQDWVALGPGSSCLALKERYGGGTLLGFDLVREGRVVQRDIDANVLSEVGANLQVVLSFSRQQGFLLGRGNQQLSPDLLRGLGPRRLKVIASRTKIGSLEGRPLLVDSGARDVDKLFTGLTQIVSGYRDRLLYRVEAA